MVHICMVHRVYDAWLCGAHLFGAPVCDAWLCGAHLFGAPVCDTRLCGARVHVLGVFRVTVAVSTVSSSVLMAVGLLQLVRTTLLRLAPSLACLASWL